MKIISFHKLIKLIKKLYHEKQLRKKLLLRADMDKTSKYREATFLNDKKGN